METFVCRYEQVKEMQQFVQKKTIDNPANFDKDADLVLLAGDFNQNAAPMNPTQKEMYDLIKAEPRYKPILQLFHSEYRSMLCALKHKPLEADKGYTLIDCLRHSEGQGRFNPITFADSYIDEATGQEMPVEPALIDDDDSCSKQALDYIFWLVPNNSVDRSQIIENVPNNSIPVPDREENRTQSEIGAANVRSELGQPI